MMIKNKEMNRNQQPPVRPAVRSGPWGTYEELYQHYEKWVMNLFVKRLSNDVEHVIQQLIIINGCYVEFLSYFEYEIYQLSLLI